MLNIEGYATTKSFTPLLNTADFQSVFGGKDGSTLPFDEKGLVRAFESVLFPDTKVEVIKNYGLIAEIKTKEYPYAGDFFVDSRFLQKSEEKPPERSATLPSSKQVLETMRTFLGFPYVWGGNCKKVLEMFDFYPPKTSLSPEVIAHWTLSGVDCSGLIYFATEGLVPRNTSSWFHFGQSVSIKGKKIGEIISVLKPLDAVVFKGHIFLIQDGSSSIESRIYKGVVQTPLQERFEELFENGYTPADEALEEKQFVVRRWCF